MAIINHIFAEIWRFVFNFLKYVSLDTFRRSALSTYLTFRVPDQVVEDGRRPPDRESDLVER